jgi:hypothetical protein
MRWPGKSDVGGKEKFGSDTLNCLQMDSKGKGQNSCSKTQNTLKPFAAIRVCVCGG